MKMRTRIDIQSQKFNSKMNALKNATNYLNYNTGIMMIKLIVYRMIKHRKIINNQVIVNLITSKTILHILIQIIMHNCPKIIIKKIMFRFHSNAKN